MKSYKCLKIEIKFKKNTLLTPHDENAMYNLAVPHKIIPAPPKRKNHFQSKGTGLLSRMRPIDTNIITAPNNTLIQEKNKSRYFIGNPFFIGSGI